MSYPHMSILCTAGDSHTHMSYPLRHVCVTVPSDTQDGHVEVRHVYVTVHSSTQDGHVGVRYVCLPVPRQFPGYFSYIVKSLLFVRKTGMPEETQGSAASH
jgi:hypothetical protein